MKEITIIINSYNGNQGHLVESIKSCLNQNSVKPKVLVSTVIGDPAIKTANKIGVECIKNQLPGIYSQLNNAIKTVNTDWFSYFSGDDVALPDKAINEIRACINGRKKICYSNFYHTDENLKIKFKTKFYNYDLKRHLTGNFVADVSTIHLSILEKHLPFDETLGNFAYWDFWLRVAKEDPGVFVFNDRSEWLYRVCKNSRHVQRKSDPGKILKNNKQRLAMFMKHRELYDRYKKLDVITSLEKIVKKGA